MILESIQQARKYQSLHPSFARVFELIAGGTLSGLSPGRHEIEGDRLYLTVGVSRRRPSDKALLEVHRRYIDVHVPLDAPDLIGWKSLTNCAVIAEPYVQESDIATFRDKPETLVAVAPGAMAVYFPEDAHAPLIGDGELCKAVIKVRVEP